MKKLLATLFIVCSLAIAASAFMPFHSDPDPIPLCGLPGLPPCK